MLFISKNTEPQAFTEAKRKLFSTPDAAKNYAGLVDSDAKSVLLDALLKEQGYLCAYCMRRIHRRGDDRNSGDIAHVEHYLPQNPSDELRASMKSNRNYDADKYSLDYGNMLAVCSGGEQEAKGVKTCDKSRSSKRMLVIGPLDESKVALVEYGRDGRISSADAEIMFDLDEQLNLNTNKFSFRRNRMEAVAKVDAWAAHLKGGHIARAQACERRKRGYLEDRALGKNAEPFLGVVLWRLDYWIRRWS